MVTLKDLKDNPGAKKNRTRVGRGIGSGKGKTCGAGHKGQKSRSGVSTLGLEGGQTPIFMRIPKRGFKNLNRKDVETVSLDKISYFIDNGKLDKDKKIDRDTMLELGLVKRKSSHIKILSHEDFKYKIDIDANMASKKASEIIEKANGKVSLA